MDAIELTPQYLKAGGEYLDSLVELGLDPEALFWGFDSVERRFVLVLVTKLLDIKGPLAISQVLFKAYRASATPQQIDPFIVRLHSPDHAWVNAISRYMQIGERITVQKLDPDTNQRLGNKVDVNYVGIGDVHITPRWAYKFSLPERRPTVDLMRQWRRFEANVERAAA